MCSTYVLSIRSVASTEKDKSVRKINSGILAGYGRDLIMKHFSFDWFKLWRNCYTPNKFETSKNFTWLATCKDICSLATGFTAGFSKATA